MSIISKIYNQSIEEIGNINLPKEIFGLKINQPLIHQVVVAQESNKRQVLAHTKTRGEVSGGGKKPWRQKGTGRARVGSSRSPLWIGGSIAFGPRKDRNFKKNINKKMKRKALFMVLSDKVESNNLCIIDSLNVVNKKTKVADELIKNIESKVINPGTKRSILIISNDEDKDIKRAYRNLSGVMIINIQNINILNLLKYRSVVIDQNGINRFIGLYKHNYKDSITV